MLSGDSNALDQLYCPIRSRISRGSQLPPVDQFIYIIQIERLQRSLHCIEKLSGPDSRAINKLCKELKLWVASIAQFFASHKEVPFFDTIQCS